MKLTPKEKYVLDLVMRNSIPFAKSMNRNDRNAFYRIHYKLMTQVKGDTKFRRSQV